MEKKLSSGPWTNLPECRRRFYPQEWIPSSKERLMCRRKVELNEGPREGHGEE